MLGGADTHEVLAKLGHPAVPFGHGSLSVSSLLSIRVSEPRAPASGSAEFCKYLSCLLGRDSPETSAQTLGNNGSAAPRFLVARDVPARDRRDPLRSVTRTANSFLREP